MFSNEEIKSKRLNCNVRVIESPYPSISAAWSCVITSSPLIQSRRLSKPSLASGWSLE